MTAVSSTRVPREAKCLILGHRALSTISSFPYAYLLSPAPPHITCDPYSKDYDGDSRRWHRARPGGALGGNGGLLEGAGQGRGIAFHGSGVQAWSESGRAHVSRGAEAFDKHGTLMLLLNACCLCMTALWCFQPLHSSLGFTLRRAHFVAFHLSWRYVVVNPRLMRGVTSVPRLVWCSPDVYIEQLNSLWKVETFKSNLSVP